MPKYLTDIRLLHTDVGPVRPVDYARNRRHPQPEAAVATTGGPAVAGNLLAGEAERVLRWVERNFTALTRTISMAEIEDLPPSMQPHVVGPPRTWVRLFRRLAHTVDYYNRAHRHWTYLDFLHATSTTCIFFWGHEPYDSLLVPFFRCLRPSMYSGYFMMLYMVFWYFVSYGSRVQKCIYMRMSMFFHMCARCQSKISLARVSVIWFNLLGTWKYVI